MSKCPLSLLPLLIVLLLSAPFCSAASEAPSSGGNARTRQGIDGHEPKSPRVNLGDAQNGYRTYLPMVGTAPTMVEYVITVADPASGKAQISLRVDHPETDVVDFAPIRFHGDWLNVTDLSAWGETGQRLPVEYRPADKLWRVTATRGAVLTVVYTIWPSARLDASGNYPGYIGPDFASLASEEVFLLPKPVSLGHVRIRFDLPAGWNVFAPWKPDGNGYDPQVVGGKIWDSLSATAFALGSFDTTTQTIGECQVTVVTHPSFRGSRQQALASGTLQIFDNYASTFGTSYDGSYLAIFTPSAPDGRGIDSGEWTNSVGIALRDGDSGMPQTAHALFHRWDAWLFGIEYGWDAWWIDEGLAVWYGAALPARLRLDSRAEESLFWSMRNDYQRYLSEYVAPHRDEPLAPRSTDMFLRYQKAALGIILLSQKIEADSNGRYSVDDLFARLAQKYNRRQPVLSGEGLRQELTALTGADFTTFYDAYVYGTTPLPMDRAFADNDGDGLANLVELAWGTHPGRADTDGDGFSDRVEVDAGTDPLNPASHP